MLREIAECVQSAISGIPAISAAGRKVTVIVEDKADVATAIRTAIGKLGVAVLISMTDFANVSGSATQQGNASMQISCYENPSLNRRDQSNLTAQGAAEAIAGGLHYCRIKAEGLTAFQVIFKRFFRDDVDEANIVRGEYEIHVRPGLQVSAAQGQYK